MKISTVFREGWLDFKRRRQLRGLQGRLDAQEKVYLGKLTVLGRRAWETGALPPGAEQEELTVLSAEEKSWQDKVSSREHDKAELEKRKKNEEERLDELIRAEDKQIKPLAKELSALKKESSGAEARLSSAEQESAGLIKAEDKLAAEVQAAPENPELQAQAAAKITANAEKKKKLAADIESLRLRLQDIQPRISPLERQVNELQGKLDRLQSEKKEKTGALQKEISALDQELQEALQNRDDLRRRMSDIFSRLGRSIIASGSEINGLAAEMESSLSTAGEISAIESEKAELEKAAAEQQGRPLLKAVFLLSAFLVLAAAAVFLVLHLVK